MTAILRLAPGDNAPWAGTYALVGHYGERTDYSVVCAEGERLPFVAVQGEHLWFVLVDITKDGVQAA